VAAEGKTKSGKPRSKCVEIKGCDANPCSRWAKCTNLPLGKFSCKCFDKFSGDGVRCTVQPGFKPLMVGGKMQIVPMIKGDAHDDQLSVIEAMLGKFAAEGEQPVAQQVAAATGEKPVNAEDRSHLAAVRARINKLESTTAAMASQAAAETEALKALQAKSKSETEKLLKMFEAKTDAVFDTVIDETHAALTHTPHAAGNHIPPNAQPAPEQAIKN
jgi:hypothetical protein